MVQLAAVSAGVVVVARGKAGRMVTDDEEIAAGLLSDKVITEREHEIWRGMSGYDVHEGFALNIKFGIGTRRMQQIAACVRYAISLRKVAFFLRVRDRSGKTVASGAHTRHTPDFTGDCRERVEWSWQAERMKAFGKLDRWSRKR